MAVLQNDRTGLDALLAKFSGLSVRPNGAAGLRIIGALEFSADGGRGLPLIEDSFHVEVLVDPDFPDVVPAAFERGGRIPQGYHQYANGELCLGAPFTLALIQKRDPTLLGFVERMLVPYLYRWAHLQKFKSAPWGELAHDRPGLIKEWSHLLGTEDTDVMSALLQLVTVRKRVANKRPCPCASGLRLGRCHHRYVNHLRRIRRTYSREMNARRARLAAHAGVKEALAGSTPTEVVTDDGGPPAQNLTPDQTSPPSG